MNLQQLLESGVFTADVKNTFSVDELTKSQNFLLSGSRGLKKGETVILPKQPIVLDSFDIGNGNFSVPTLCVVAEVVDKNGVSRASKISLSFLKRESYGQTLKNVKEGEYPSIPLHSITIDVKINDSGAELVNDCKFTVKDVKNHYFAKFTENKLTIVDGLVVLEAKSSPMLINA